MKNKSKLEQNYNNNIVFYNEVYETFASFLAQTIGKECLPEYFTEAMMWPETHEDPVTGNKILSIFDSILEICVKTVLCTEDLDYTAGENMMYKHLDFYTEASDYIEDIIIPELSEILSNNSIKAPTLC